MKKYFLPVLLAATALLFTGSIRAQVTVSGAAKVLSGSSSCYSASTTCTTHTYCWSGVGLTSITPETSCGGGGGGPDVVGGQVGGIQPNTGGGGSSCVSPAMALVVFPTVTALKTVTVVAENYCSITGSLTVTVVPPPNKLTITNGNQSNNCSTTPSPLNTSSPSGGDGTYAYQWLSSTDNITFTPITGAVASSYAPSAPAAGTSMYYEVQLISFGQVSTSASVSVTSLIPALAPATITPSTQTVSSGGTPSPLQVSVQPSGGACGTPNYTYLWYSSSDGTNFSSTTVTTPTYTLGPASVTTWYKLAVALGGQPVYSNIVEVVVPVVSSDWSYVRTRDIKLAGVLTPAAAAALTSNTDVTQTTQYLDGLGRPIQSVSQQASPLGYDMVSLQTYDAYGREAVKYLPYTSPSNNGNFKPNAYSEQNTFNAAQFPTDTYFYGQVNFEPSPLNRTQETLAPGNSWVGAGKGVTAGYLVNAAADSVPIWTISSLPETLPVDKGNYGAGTLLKTTTTDESNHTVVEYKDQQGKTVLKKVQLWDAPATGPSGWLDTYYVYDSLDNLRFVIPPKAVVWLQANGWNFAASGGSSVASELCFRYEYDFRKRMIIKKVPGAGETWMVYDIRDRLVMSQDSNLRSIQKWLFTCYDALNRADSTGLMTDPTHYNSLSFHTNAALQSPTYPNLSGYTVELLTRNFYDDYTWVAATAAPVQSAFDASHSTSGTWFITGYNASPVYAVAITPHPITRGMPTGVAKKVLYTTSQFLYTSMFYDDRGRIIQTSSNNYGLGKDTVTNQYNFSGKVLRSLHGQSKAVNAAQSHMIMTRMDYDQVNRLNHIYKIIDNPSSLQLICNMQYDELGRLYIKYLGNSLDSMLYSYNIRGWLTGINKNFVGGTTHHWFGMELAYDNPTSVTGTTYANPAYNGNISGVIWKSQGDGINRKYDFTYDDVNRLTGANFNQYVSGTWGKSSGGGSPVTIDFSVSGLSYDPNGNIQSMIQQGFKIGGTGPIDSLSYTYTANTNKLLQVHDQDNDPNSVLGDFHYNGVKGGSDYSYDGNGNLAKDNNKGIGYFTYNYLNLPANIYTKGKGYITYNYDASGTKLQKQVKDSTTGTITLTTYLGEFQYTRRAPFSNINSGNDTLQFITTEEGRARWAFHKRAAGDTVTYPEYDFVERDHLGNERVILTQERDTTQYIATMEAANRATENALFYNIGTTCVARSSVPAPGYPDDLTFTNPNDSVAKLNGNGPTVGPAIILKVMSGDIVDVGTQYYYNNGSYTTGSLPPVNLLNSLASGLATLSSAASESITTLTNTTTSPLLSALMSSVSLQNGTSTTTPQAYLNWILLDKQFRYVAGNCSGAIQVGAAGQNGGGLQPALARTGILMSQSGYLYIYVSNATKGWDVFFDNISVHLYTRQLIEENHYYPFGLVMQGISDRALKSNYPENKFRFGGKELQNKEFSDGTGLEEYDFGARHYDPQIGRWHNLDPRADKLPQHSPFEYSINNPILFVDPDGKFPYPIHIRSFAPFPTFGGGFAGDNRGWSTTLGAREVAGGVTSRMQQTFTVDPSQRSVTGLSTWSDPSHHPIFGTGTAADRYDVKAGYKSSDGGNVAVVTSNMAANLPLIPSADIDIHSAIRLTENLKNGTLNVQMSMDGDRFPAAEAFIGDTKGQQLFIGVSGYDGNPYTSLPGNNDRPMFYVNFDVKINDKGEFVGVVSGGQAYTVADWNKKVQATPLEYQKPRNSGNSGQSSGVQGGGCIGNGCAIFAQMAQEAIENMPMKF